MGNVKEHALGGRSPRSFSLVIAAVVLMAACDSTQTTAPTPVLAPDLAMTPSLTAEPGCYGVQFDLLFRGTAVDPELPPEFEGELVGGDLEGTVDIVLTGATDPTGRTNTATFRFTWNITGGVIAELIGQSFVTDIDNRNLNQIPPPTNTGTAVGTHRVVSGVERANLTYTPGEAEIVSLDPFAFENLLHHRGVICP
jgi:hypothetical protein